MVARMKSYPSTWEGRQDDHACEANLSYTWHLSHMPEILSQKKPNQLTNPSAHQPTS